MIKIQKKPLFKFFISCLLFLPLVYFLSYTYHYQQMASKLLVFLLILFIIYLVYLLNRFIHKKALLNLQTQDQREKINLVEAEIQYEQKAIKSFKEKIVQVSHLKGLTEKLSQCLTIEDTVKALSSEIPHVILKKDITFIFYLYHLEVNELALTLSKKGKSTVNIKTKNGDMFDQWVIKNLQPIIIDDIHNDYRFDLDEYPLSDARQFNSLIGAPLLIGNKVWGMIRLDSPQKNYFTVDDLRFLTTIGDLSAVAVENARLYERLEQMAIRDGLTNLYLKRFLLERMSEELSRHLRRNDELSFLMIDLDKFKEYNDNYGHIAGDIVLRTLGKLLSEFFHEPGHLVSRYGGEEFVVLLPHCSKEKAIKLAEKVRKKIEAEEVSLRRQKTHITVSIGVASFPQDGQMKEDVIFKADKALYKAKHEGRNRVCPA